MSEELIDLIKPIKKKIINYFFDKNENKKFKNDKNIKLTSKWKNIFSYPEELNILMNNDTNKSTIIDIIKKLFIKNEFRTIHPILLIIFYEELSTIISYNIIVDKLDNEPFIQINKLPSSNLHCIEIRKQINISLRIFWKIINDKYIKKYKEHYDEDELIEEIINNIYFNHYVEKKINFKNELYEQLNNRFIDYGISLNINNNENDYMNETQNEFIDDIFIEINEDHHIPIEDKIRKLNVFRKTGKNIIDYLISSNNINDLINKIKIEIAIIIYNNYNKDYGVHFYISCVLKHDIKMSSFFLDIYNKTFINKIGFELSEIILMFKESGFKKINKFVETVIIPTINRNKKKLLIEENKDNFIDSKLSSVGVDRIITLPRDDEFKDIIKFIQYYTEFRESFYTTIFNFLDANKKKEEIFYSIMNDETINDFEYNIINPTLEFVFSYLKSNKKNIENMFKIKLNKNIPLIMECENKDVDKIFLIKKLPIYKDIINTKFDTVITKIEDHKYIDRNKMKSIYDFIKENH
jgi:hypothetical protein